MNSPSPAPQIELQLMPSSSAFASNDQRWLGQVSQLLGELKRNAGEIRKEITPVPGQKGGMEAIILALGTSGALTASVTIFKAWLARSNDRTLRVKGRFKGQEIDLEISGSNVEEKTLQLMTELVRQ